MVQRLAEDTTFTVAVYKKMQETSREIQLGFFPIDIVYIH